MKKGGLLLILCTLLIFRGQAQGSDDPRKEPKITWDGYIQLRATTNFDDHTGFALRRLKFWLRSGPGFSDHWSFKVQTTFSSFHKEKFFLQDVKLGYRTGVFSLEIGQFVPEYSLQRFQHDYLIPPIERAKVINTLIPDGTLGVRDLGVQGTLTSRNHLVQTSLGIFNGYGILEYRLNNTGFMITHKTGLNIPWQNNSLQVGYSFQYRKAENLRIPFVLPDTVFFTGNDIRYNFFAMFSSKYFLIQGEYLHAGFDGETADGYYILSAVTIHKSQVVLSWEKYKDLIAGTSDEPYIRAGYNLLIKSYKLKVSLDNYFQLAENRIQKYFATVQLQFFIK